MIPIISEFLFVTFVFKLITGIGIFFQINSRFKKNSTIFINRSK